MGRQLLSSSTEAVRRQVRDRVLVTALHVMTLDVVKRKACRDLVKQLCCSRARQSRYVALQEWTTKASFARRERRRFAVADAVRHRNVLRMFFVMWSVSARRISAQMYAAQDHSKKLMERSAYVMVHSWSQHCKWKTFSRMTLLHVVSLRMHRVSSVAFTCWRQRAGALAALEVRFRLRVDEFRRSQRRRLRFCFLIAWRAETAKSLLAARTSRLTKVFACWRLWLQEQLLLRHYLHECSLSNFRGENAASSSCSVGHKDFEQLYSQMAAYRWDDVDVFSD